MKRLIILIVLLTGALCNVNAQDRLHSAHTPTPKSDEIKSFITQMYSNKRYEDYDFLRKHCSAGLLKKLQDAYPYDADGIAYATWLFRSGKQDSKPGTEGKTIMLQVKLDGDWFVYTALDMGWKFTNRIKITSKGGEILIEDVCTAKQQRKICFLSEDLKGTIEPNVLYSAGGFYKLGRGDFENYFEQIFQLL